MHQPSRRFSPLKIALFSGAIATTATLSVYAPVWSNSLRTSLRDNNPKILVDEVWQLVNSEYVDGTFNKTNWQAVRQDLLSRNYTSRQQAYAAVKQALEKLNDPYTRFLDPEAYAALTDQTSGELSGVGIRLELNEKTNKLTVGCNL